MAEVGSSARPAGVAHRTAAVSITGQRGHNEDTVLTLQGEHGGLPLTLVAVADGMGGYALGEVASQLACDALEARWPALQEALATRSLYEAGLAFFSDAYALANRHIAAHTESHLDGDARMGTTLVVALVLGDRALFANLGDSRGYLVTGGRVEQITDDHSVVADAVRRGVMTEEEAQQSPYRHALTRSLDGSDDETPDLFPPQAEVLELRSGAVLCLCSDGLSGVVTDEMLRAHLEAADDLQQTAHALVEQALALGSLDNVSIVLLRLDALRDPVLAGYGPGPAAPAAPAPGGAGRRGFADGHPRPEEAALLEEAPLSSGTYRVAIGLLVLALLGSAAVLAWFLLQRQQARPMVELLEVPAVVDLSAETSAPLRWRATGFGDRAAFELNVKQIDPADDALLAETSVPLLPADTSITWQRLADGTLNTPGSYAVAVLATDGDTAVRSTSSRLVVTASGAPDETAHGEDSPAPDR